MRHEHVKECFEEIDDHCAVGHLKNIGRSPFCISFILYRSTVLSFISQSAIFIWWHRMTNDWVRRLRCERKAIQAMWKYDKSESTSNTTTTTTNMDYTHWKYNKIDVKSCMCMGWKGMNCERVPALCLCIMKREFRLIRCRKKGNNTA